MAQGGFDSPRRYMNATHTNKGNTMINDNDILSLAKITINELYRDNMIQTFVDSGEQERVEMAEAYVMSAVKRFDKFMVQMKTNSEFARFITLRIFDSLAQEID
jgi:hypothetical protein